LSKIKEFSRSQAVMLTSKVVVSEHEMLKQQSTNK